MDEELSLAGLVIMTIYLLLDSDRTQELARQQFKKAYYSQNKQMMKNLVEFWPEQSRTYGMMNGATPYFLPGDSLAGIPFFINNSPKQNCYRIWVEISHDDEGVALDIVFPPDKAHFRWEVVMNITYEYR